MVDLDIKSLEVVAEIVFPINRVDDHFQMVELVIGYLPQAGKADYLDLPRGDALYTCPPSEQKFGVLWSGKFSSDCDVSLCVAAGVFHSN